ncbi:MAG: L-ribulose-5-phosphate 3-epimerase [Clostridiales bacterium]|nr:L-ribulose-5-phosphate 3-epimerase [Clostridiales bacterium]
MTAEAVMYDRLGLYEKAMPQGLGWDEMLASARRAGFDFLDISIDEGEMRLARLFWTADQRAAVRQAARQADLPIGTMCLSAHRKYPLGSRDAATRARSLEIFQRAADLAVDLGARVIQLAGYDVYYEQGGDDTAAYFAENLARCAELAAAVGVPMGFETMETPFMDTVAKAMAYVRLIDSPYLGVYPDLGNLTNAGLLYGFDPIDELQHGRGRLLAMHLKETLPGQYRDLRFGEGHVDFLRGIAAAWALGIHRFVAECWYDGAPDWQASIAQVSDFVRGHFA